MGLNSFTKEEKLSFTLSELYLSYGYCRYKMNKFEEYSLYAENKDFLSSSNVITFMSADGKLLALRPDVTLSILKNTKATSLLSEKVFYTEKVYRFEKETKAFKEISQVGVEFLGNLDKASVAEVIDLSLNSLNAISKNFVLDLSSIAFTLAMFDEYEISSSLREKLTKLLNEKNLHEIDKIENVTDEFKNAFKSLCQISDKAEDALSKMKALVKGEKTKKAYSDLEGMILALKSTEHFDKLRIDFSVECDLNYYTDIVFCGYILEMPKAILKGGRYDGLVNKMKKDIGAIGFAVYVGDIANAHHTKQSGISILLTAGASTESVFNEASRLRASGENVRIARNMPIDLNIEKVYTMENGKAVEVKND